MRGRMNDSFHGVPDLPDLTSFGPGKTGTSTSGDGPHGPPWVGPGLGPVATELTWNANSLGRYSSAMQKKAARQLRQFFSAPVFICIRMPLQNITFHKEEYIACIS